MSGHIIFMYRPIHWQSKRQTITARSSAEAEIYATDECVRELTFIRKLFRELKLIQTFMKHPIPVKNDNMTCVQWCKNRTTRTIRHIQLRDYAVRENVQNKKNIVEHIFGSENIADIFTKEDKEKSHFERMRNKILFPPFKCHNTIYLPKKYFYDTFSSTRYDIIPATGDVRNGVNT